MKDLKNNLKIYTVDLFRNYLPLSTLLKKAAHRAASHVNGGPKRNRTSDRPVMSRKLYQLSYRPY
jgi:hypothetical protein